MFKFILFSISLMGCVIGLTPEERCESVGYPAGTESFAHCLALEGGNLDEIVQSLPKDDPVSKLIDAEQIATEIDPENFCIDNGFRKGTAFFKQCLVVAEGRNQFYPDESFEDDPGLLLSAEATSTGEAE